MGRFQDFAGELRRRRVFRAIVAYAIAAFAILQVVEPVMHGLELPDWVLKTVVVALGVGFPIVVILAWAFDLKATGIERAQAAAAGRAGSPRGARLALLLVGLGMLAAAPGLVYYLVFRDRAAAQARTRAPVGGVLPSVAVLPFVDMSAQRDQEYFSDGLAEEILNALSHIDGLRVTGRTSSFSFKGKSDDLRAIGQKLNVGAVLEGSVRRDGNRIRVTAQVVNVADGFHIWSETYDRELQGVFAVQDDIARSVAEALKVRLLPSRAASADGKGAANPEAYTQFLLGRQLFNQVSNDSVRRSAEAFQRAVSLDPTFAPAWAALAMSVQDLNHDAPGATEENRRRGRAAAEKAVSLDPGLAEGYNARGVLRARWDWDWPGAQADLDRARALQPGDAVSQRRYGILRLMLGQPSEAISALRRAIDLDPLSAIAWSWLAKAYVSTGDFPQANGALERALQIAPESEDLRASRGVLSILEGKPAEALKAIDGIHDEGERLAGLALAEHDLGHPAAAQKALASLKAGYPGHPYEIALVHAWFGERDSAFEWLDRAYASRDWSLADVRYDPFLKPIRDDARYAQLLRRMNLPVD
ncbi:MAG TPA: tetratricopeptide repeat protein [Anaeromyxobacteraceae bacterium]|nr:tetratricopeptide repeat protein [Anaeromyxobacteraceae bacterium]